MKGRRISPQINPPSPQSHRHGWLVGLGVFAVWILIWWALALIVDMEFWLPSPSQTVRALTDIAGKSEFWLSVAFTFLRITAGYIMGAVLGLALGVGAYFLPLLRALVEPFLAFLRATPVASFILLVILWLDADRVVLLITVIMVTPIVFGNVLAGLNAHSRKLREVAYVYGFSRRECFKNLFLPSVKPYFFTGCVTSLGLAWKSGVAAEVLCLTELSIGRGMYEAKAYMETPRLFAWTAVVVCFSMLLEAAVTRLVRRFGGDNAESGSDGET